MQKSVKRALCIVTALIFITSGLVGIRWFLGRARSGYMDQVFFGIKCALSNKEYGITIYSEEQTTEILKTADVETLPYDGAYYKLGTVKSGKREVPVIISYIHPANFIHSFLMASEYTIKDKALVPNEYELMTFIAKPSFLRKKWILSEFYVNEDETAGSGLLKLEKVESVVLTKEK